MPHKYLDQGAGFIGASSSYEESDTVIIGAPMDYTVSFRPGTRMGPGSIRSVSEGIEEYSFYLDKDLSELKYCDLGDILLPFGNVEASLHAIQETVSSILAAGKSPLTLGGEHLITYPIVKAFAQQGYDNLTVIQFDAHADLRTDYMGVDNSHATVMRKVAEIVGSPNVFQLGIRSGTKEEFDYGNKETNFFPEDIVSPLNQVIEKIGERPVYITVDIDVVDPAFAPGTGTPEPGGCTSTELIKALHRLSELNVVGFDLVEVSPMMDVGDCTSLLGAKLTREALLSFFNKCD
ncbi:agmatinase [Desulfitispora alkaliphila]|uniref:agmatinase n=1 Tax=Desulfitispora alkaliphila TaxID=622674 RepID=UPI003D1CB152